MIALLILALASLGAAAPSASSQPLPRTLANSRFVYVTAYDGDQFDSNLLPEDRAAIARVQDAIEKWGKLTIVYRPQEADVILAVQSRRKMCWRFMRRMSGTGEAGLRRVISGV